MGLKRKIKKNISKFVKTKMLKLYSSYYKFISILMNDKNTILSEYVPLQIITMYYIECQNRADGTSQKLRREHLLWCLESKRNYNELNKEYYINKEKLDNSPHIFCGELRQSIQLPEILGDEPLRIPMINHCQNDESIMIHNGLIEDVDFADSLGVIKTPAILRDAALKLRSGFSALSFYKSFSYTQIIKLFSDVPVSQRPIINLRRKYPGPCLLIHTSLLNKWKALGLEDVAYEFDDELKNLRRLQINDNYLGIETEPLYPFEEYQEMDHGKAEMQMLIDKYNQDEEALIKQINANEKSTDEFLEYIKFQHETTYRGIRGRKLNIDISDDQLPIRMHDYFTEIHFDNEDVYNYNAPYFIYLKSAANSAEIKQYLLAFSVDSTGAIIENSVSNEPEVRPQSDSGLAENKVERIKENRVFVIDKDHLFVSITIPSKKADLDDAESEHINKEKIENFTNALVSKLSDKKLFITAAVFHQQYDSPFATFYYSRLLLNSMEKENADTSMVEFGDFREGDELEDIKRYLGGNVPDELYGLFEGMDEDDDRLYFTVIASDGYSAQIREYLLDYEYLGDESAFDDDEVIILSDSLVFFAVEKNYRGIEDFIESIVRDLSAKNILTDCAIYRHYRFIQPWKTFLLVLELLLELLQSENTGLREVYRDFENPKMLPGVKTYYVDHREYE